MAAAMPPPPMSPAKRVCIIGGGSGGLAAIKALREAAAEHNKLVDIQCFEQRDDIGGQWYYSKDPSDSNLTSIYRDLITNLPAATMQYSDLPFHSASKYATKDEVIKYLHDFADTYELRSAIQFGVIVQHVCRAHDMTYSVRVKHIATQAETHHTFDAIIVASGHFSVPRWPCIPGLKTQSNIHSQSQLHVIHSSKYRRAEEFTGMIVLVIGASHSGLDIANEVAAVAKSVYVSAREGPAYEGVAETVSGIIAQKDKPNMLKRLQRVNEVERISDDGTLYFFDDKHSPLKVDAIILATGFHYRYPFLDEPLRPSVEDNIVHPLFEHIFHADFEDGTLSFLAIPWRIVPFPLSELQSALIAGVLLGNLHLPSSAEMYAERNALYTSLKQRDIPLRYTHLENQIAYCKRIISYLDADPKRKVQFFARDDRSVRRA